MLEFSRKNNILEGLDLINSMVLDRKFYLQPVQTVARNLLGKKILRQLNNERLGGIIIETEAYDGEADLACHAHSGKTERNQMMYVVGGHAYVYFTYGMHWMLNCVTGCVDYPAAVLIRAILPTDGIEVIQAHRSPIAEKHWCDGPAKLTRALAIDGYCNGLDLCDPSSRLVIEMGADIPDQAIETTVRIGISYAPEPWLSKPWRYKALITDNRQQ